MQQKEIDELKKQYGTVYQFDIPPATKWGDSVTFVFRKLDLKVLAATTKLKEKDEIQAMQFMMNSLLVVGNKALLSDPDIFLSLSGAFNEMLSVRIAKVKEL